MTSISARKPRASEYLEKSNVATTRKNQGRDVGERLRNLGRYRTHHCMEGNPRRSPTCGQGQRPHHHPLRGRRELACHTAPASRAERAAFLRNLMNWTSHATTCDASSGETIVLS